MDTEISRITEFDGGLIRELFEKADVSHPEPNPDFFEDDKNIMLVARTGGIVSGFLWAYVLVSPDKFKSKMFLYSIDTFQPFRRNGIATLLIKHVKEIARDYDCYKMMLSTGRNNLPAIGLYRKNGGILQEEGINFEFDQETLNA